jgi:hypothetical protein
MTELVLGAAYGYSAEQVKPFVTTLRRYYTGKIAFLVSVNLDPTLVELCQESGIDFFIVDGDQSNPIHMQWARFFHYENILSHPFFTNTTRVLLTDIRDVIFQAHPFSLPMTTDFEFFTEPETIKNSFVNRGWLQERYGVAETYAWENKNIICSGTIRTTMAGAQVVVRNMIMESEKLQATGRSPLDQPMLNYLVYSGAFFNYRVFDNGEGAVDTLHFAKELKFSPSGVLLNKNNQPVPIIHQWDRTQALVPVFEKIFA